MLLISDGQIHRSQVLGIDYTRIDALREQRKQTLHRPIAGGGMQGCVSAMICLVKIIDGVVRVNEKVDAFFIVQQTEDEEGRAVLQVHDGNIGSKLVQHLQTLHTPRHVYRSHPYWKAEKEKKV